MTGGEALVRSLIANGANVAFGIPGKHNLSVYDALLDHPQIRHILVRNEQAASIMANAGGRATGTPGVCLVSTGPAACNALIGVADAARESVPMLVVASQIDSSLIGQSRGAFHEMPDQKGMFAAAGAWTIRAHGVEQIPPAVNAAWVAMTHGRPRPAYVEIPEDVLNARAAVETSRAPDAPRPGASPTKIAQVLSLLNRAERPIVYAGGGAAGSAAGGELLKFIEAHELPVVSTINGKGVVPEDHRFCAGVLPLNDSVCRNLLAKCDLVLAFGTGFGEVSTDSWRVPFPCRLVHVDIDGSQIGRNVPASIGIAADVRTVLEQLNSADIATPRPESGWTNEVVGVSLALRESGAGQSGAALARAMRAALPRDSVIVGDAQSWGIWLVRDLPVYGANQMIWPINFGTLGYGIPGALGVKATIPHRAVIATCGDGGFTFYSNELATAVQHGLNIIVILVNNSSLAIIRSLQQRLYGASRVFSSDLRNPDFVAYAESFGCAGRRVRDLEAIGPALAEALHAQRPTVIEIPFPIDVPGM